MDWIKNLVLELIRAPIKEAAGDVNFQKNFKSMIKIVLGQPYIQLVYKYYIVTVVVVVVVVIVIVVVIVVVVVVVVVFKQLTKLECNIYNVSRKLKLKI